jgi:hypothetical protein
LSIWSLGLDWNKLKLLIVENCPETFGAPSTLRHDTSRVL